MFICKEHGTLRSDWCPDCGEVVDCDCSNLKYTRFKDLTYDTESGERTITVRLYHCGTYGDPHHITIPTR